MLSFGSGRSDNQLRTGSWTTGAWKGIFTGGRLSCAGGGMLPLFSIFLKEKKKQLTRNSDASLMSIIHDINSSNFVYVLSKHPANSGALTALQHMYVI
jgi:hypothetical protein